MFSKFYEKARNFIKENYKVLIIYAVIIFLFTYKLPFYIYTGGGTLDTSSKVSINDSYEVEGKFNFAYVSSRNAIIPLYLYALINDDWDIESMDDYKYNSNETVEDLNFRDKLDLSIANSNATLNAYKIANKEVSVTSSKIYITYLADNEKVKTDLKIGDIILNIEDENINNLEDIRTIVNKKEVGDSVKIKVRRGNEDIYCSSQVFLEEDTKLIGISVSILNELETNPEIKISFSKNESGPSGGLMLALTIYNELTEYDLTHGLNIVGTGTIDEYGNIGAIGGVKYKLQGAVSNKADIFLVPNEKNYDEAVKIKEEKGYNIEIIGVDTLTDAINKLKEVRN